MYFERPFDSYKITYYSGFSNDALIQLASKGQWVGQITFAREGAGSNSATNNFIALFLSTSKFNDVVNILRYEKPLAISLETDNGVGMIFTMDTEPIGEQE